ncbi:hypothetical protein G3N59_01045 [Paraburkholderia sp. Ac-20340]|uniref:hypothetical protein n=1 Tax=Paraburkholderia sp. Ac-20340 TaxID=2703888 RepID=UPI00197E3CA0|nr:hypothetical protein [Paraburkholderia sp. Ac-20340]MBN3851953.1 hypothetical protein [Paraburkholderia sp. Ac-20340]
MDMTIKNAPQRIYLVLGDGLPSEAIEFSSLHEVTWCADKQSAGDIEYVLAPSDAVKAPEAWAVEWPSGPQETWHSVYINERDALDWASKHENAKVTPLYAAPVASAAVASTTPMELLGVEDALKNEYGFWRTCSGCHETEDGHPVGHYPFSAILKCDLGSGCRECGGIGAVWDDTDYEAMAAAGDADEIAREQAEEAKTPVAWVRYRSDGGFEGPIMDTDSRMCDTRRNFWTPLYAATVALGAPDGLARVLVERSYDMRAKAIIAFNTAEQSGKDRDDALDAAWHAMLNASPTVGADVGAPINLEGLRKKLLTPRKILRDDQGFLTHPDYPICDEGTRADTFLEAFGIETRFRAMENDLPDLHERWCDGGLDNCSEWTPTAPEGDGWLLLEIYDTEDGPYALFGRDKYEAENALKRQRMRDDIQRRQASEGDAQ